MIKIKYLGHSAFELVFNGATLIFDPFISPNEAAAAIDVQSLKADYVLLSHGHGDHVYDAEAIARKNDALIISSYEVVTWYEQKGLRGHGMNLGGKWKFDFGYVKYVQAVHSSMLPDVSFGGPSGGFVIWDDKHCFYFAGDTALTMDMKLIPVTCPQLDFAILPVGDNFTMGYEDALIAAGYIQCDNIIGCHFDTFGFIKINHEDAVKAFENEGKTLILPEIGQNIEF